MNKSIVIGANGYLGRHLAFFLKEAGFDNRNYDLQKLPLLGVDCYSPIDIAEKQSFEKLDPAVDYIFFFAGLSGTSDGFSKYEDFNRVNELGLLNMLTWMKEKQCRARIVFPSTRLIYKGKKGQPLKEDDAKETRTIYAVNKLAAENILWAYQNAFGIDYTIFRICVPYGNCFDDLFSYGTIGFFLDKARKQEPIMLFGDGSLRRTFTHVEDICRIIISGVKNDKTKNDVFNIGGETLSLMEVAQIVAQKFNTEVKFSAWPELAARIESGDTIFDDGKLRKLGLVHYNENLSGWISSI